MPDSSAGLGDVLVVLGLVFVVSWTGGLAVIALVGTERGRNSALLTIAGGRPGVVTRSTIYEEVIYAVTAIFFGALTLLVSAVTIALAAKVTLGDVLSGMPWEMLGGLALITLVTPVIALIVQAFFAARTPLSEALRVT